MKKKLKDNRGFTILETMIAMAIFSIALLGSGVLYLRASHTNTNGNIISSANFLAKATLESYKNLPLDSPDLVDGFTHTETGLDEFGNAGGIYTRVVKVEDIDSGAGRKVTITVTWPQRANYASDAIVLVSNLRGEGI